LVIVVVDSTAIKATKSICDLQIIFLFLTAKNNLR